MQKIVNGDGCPQDGWTKLGAFHGCEKLQKIMFAAGSRLKEIGHGTFYGCKMLQSIALPDSLEIIGDASFY